MSSQHEDGLDYALSGDDYDDESMIDGDDNMEY